ncbi:MAG TPA: PKD domain-containing protein [Thermoplasmata archaeon]|nr:PKD domain-containing protein [Thermoplasmata archaeon]
MSTPTAAVVMIVVIALVAAGGYFAFASVKPTTSSTSTCAPATSYICVNLAAAHDMTLLVPFKAAQAGTTVPFTASFQKGETSSSYNFNFGDGNNTTSKTPTAAHVYAQPGTYLASVTASVNGAVHDNFQSLVAIVVSPSYTSSSSGAAPSVGGVVAANTSDTTTGATTVIGQGQSVTLSGSYTSAPTNPSFLASPPTIAATGSGVTTSNTKTTNSTATTTVIYANPGIYTASFIGKSVSGSTTVFQNYVWTVFVAASGVHAGLAGGATASSSPHKGSLNIYEYSPGGSTSEDPALDYETVGYEPIINVYQTLIAYNGSDSGPGYENFVPVQAACVPGSPACSKLFSGDNLTSGNNYTFVLSGTSQFYDSSNQKTWGVYPSDVLFSLARTLAFATQPAFGANNGWIVAQSLLSTGSSAWDGGIHATLNNTPQGIFGAIGVNTSACPTAAMSAPYHGCVTFNAGANGVSWPYFLELISDGLGSSIVPCGFFSASPQSAGIPGWTQGNTADQGDHPCLLPGGATSTSSAAFQEATSVTNMTPTSWDTWETDGSGALGHFFGNVQWTMAGSGPYYMASLKIGSSYLLKANPGYAQNPQCTWTGCEPAVGAYVPSVSVLWEQSQLPGEEAYQAGQADLASIPATDAALLLQLIQEQKVSATTFPSISICFFPFSFLFSKAGAQKYTTNPITVPQDFFTNIGVRNFFVNSYPYQTAQQTISTKDGIQYLFNYGGAIPQFMSNYYPTNISWQSGDPSSSTSTVGSAAWWWTQITTPGNPQYDAELNGCSTSSPCEVPFFGETGAPDVDQRLALWASEISSLSGGKLKMDVVDIDFTDLVLNSLYNGPGSNPMPFYTLGWAPDYPDPTDYMVPLYQPDGSYTHADALSEQLEGAPAYGVTAYNATTCHSWQDYGYWSTQANTPGAILPSCEGTAYAAMSLAIAVAGHLPNGPQRVLVYNMIEHIANALALYTYWGQENVVLTTAPWINAASANSNIVIGGGGDQTWYSFTGNGLV